MSLRRRLLFGQPKTPYIPKLRHHTVISCRIEINDISLLAWLAQPLGHVSTALLYFNGRRESPTTIFRYLAALPNCAVLVFHHRGLGGSGGSPSEMQLVKDGSAMLDWLVGQLKLPSDAIFIAGRSLGSGVAVQVASAQNVAGLILISPYDRLINVVRMRIRFFPETLLQDKFESTGHIKGVQCPVLVIFGEKDTTVPPLLSQNLFTGWTGHHLEHCVPEGGHRGLLRYASVESAIANFLDRVTW